MNQEKPQATPLSDAQITELREIAQLIETEQLDVAQPRLETLRGEIDNHPDVLQLSGALAMRQGQLSDAIAYLTQVTRLTPSFIPAWVSLFQCHQAMGAMGDAIHALKNAVQINSSDHNLLLALADTQQKAGQFDGVLDTLTRLAPEIAAENPIQSLKAAALQGLGRLDEAEEVLDTALARKADDHHLRLQLASVQHTQRRYDEAAIAYREILETQPGLTPARFGLAICHEALGRYDEAIAAMRQVVEEDPEHLPAYTLLGSYLERTGDIEGAEEVLNEALNRDPDNVAPHLHLAQCERRRGDHAGALARLNAVPDQRIPDIMQVAWHAERGQLQDRLGEYGRAMACFEQGNEVAQRLWQADNPGPNAFASRVMKTLQWMRETPSAEPLEGDQLPTPQPVFLIGFPRTGTTLLGGVLGAHSQVVELDEYPTLHFLAQVIDQKLGGYPKRLMKLDDEQRDRLRNSYMAHMSRYADFAECTHVIDKLPMNLEYLPIIAQVFPGARVILARRHPLAAILSCYMQPFQLNAAMANFHDLKAAAAIYAALDELVQQTRRLWPQLAIHEVRYEDMVSQPEDTLRSLLTFLELPLEEGLLDEAQRSGGGTRTPSYRQVDQAIHETARDHWQHYAAWLEPVEQQLAQQIADYGR